MLITRCKVGTRPTIRTQPNLVLPSLRPGESLKIERLGQRLTFRRPKVFNHVVPHNIHITVEEVSTS